ncbi:MAG: phospho-N-acetylmuramoyl-pentapeptide-transferase [Bacteroidales bacterium]|nr:phospho-N-acetylmuramoyl-pentapeptide-transferase [Bacteroidales bacterium]
MLYYLFEWLDKIDFPGAGAFHYISTRSALSFIVSLLLMLLCGKPFIKWLKKKQIGETVRHLGLEGQEAKAGTPTMGGLLILGAIVIPTLLFAKLDNPYILIMLFTTVWLGLVGFMDDYIKVFRHNKEGLAGKYKIMGQVVLGIVVGISIMYIPGLAENATRTTIPFVKGHELDYSKIITWMGPWAEKWVWLLYALVVILVVTAMSNAANLTDGIDGLATGVAAVNGGALAILAWLSGNVIFAQYLNIMYLSNIGELAVFSTAFMGATLGFLWFNTHPAEIFMGDTGSLALGGIIAVFALLIKKELLLPLLCGIYLVEDLSVIIQRIGTKNARKKRHIPAGTPVPVEMRPFLMTPLHHHYQKKGMKEEKIVMRFIIVAILLAITTIITLKIR